MTLAKIMTLGTKIELIFRLKAYKKLLNYRLIYNAAAAATSQKSTCS